jgi:hypothetical protein
MEKNPTKNKLNKFFKAYSIWVKANRKILETYLLHKPKKLNVDSNDNNNKNSKVFDI